MTSEAGKMVAQDVIKAVGKGVIPKKTKIAVKRGYSKKSARSGKATETKGYKDKMETFVSKLKTERDLILGQMRLKRNRAQYQHLTRAFETLSKQIQLAEGTPTESIKFDFSKEAEDRAKKYD